MKTRENSNLRKQLVDNLEEIQKYYMNHTQKETAEQFNISIATLTRFCKDNNIKKSTSRKLDYQDLYPKIKNLQDLSWTPTEICKKLNISNNSMHNILDNIEETNKDIFLDINTEFFWYLLGFFTADGSREPNYISLYQSDYNFLKMIQYNLGGGHIGKEYKGNYQLRFKSSSFSSILDKYNIQSNKTFTISFIPAPTTELQLAYIRGVFDGDGCMYYNYTSGKFTEKNYNLTTASKFFAIQLSDWLTNNKVENYIITKTEKSEYYIILISKFEDMIKFGKLIYQNCNYCLFRKYLIFSKFLNLIKLEKYFKNIYDIVDGSQK